MFLFRPILNTSAEYASFHFPAQHDATLPQIMQMSLVIFSGGILANLFVVYLSFFSPLVTGNFKYFMANLALCDMCFDLSVCFQASSQMYHDFMNVPFTATTCYARAVFPYVFAACIFGFALPLTAANRYIVIVMGREDWLNNRRAFLLCVCSFLPLTWPLIDFLFAPYVTYFLNCDFIIFTPYVNEVFLIESLLFGMPLLGFCSLRVYQVLSQHVSIVSAKLNKTSEQIRNEKSILKAIVIQALLPLICTLPAVFVLLVSLFHGWDSTAFNLTIFRYGEKQQYQYTTTHLCLLIAVVVPVLDPFITLRVVRSYREAANQFLTKFKICKKITDTSLEERASDTAHVLSRLHHAAPFEPKEAWQHPFVASMS